MYYQGTVNFLIYIFISINLLTVLSCIYCFVHFVNEKVGIRESYLNFLRSLNQQITRRVQTELNLTLRLTASLTCIKASPISNCIRQCLPKSTQIDSQDGIPVATVRAWITHFVY